MTAPPINDSRPVPDVSDLLPAAKDIAIRLDRVPSLDVLRKELHIGYDKAKPLQEALERLELEYEQRMAASSPDQSDLDEPEPIAPAAESTEPQVTPSEAEPSPVRPKVAVWPLFLLALPASVAIWSGWVGLGGLTGFGVVHPLPGIVDGFSINSAITLPIGFEAYAAYALRYWFGSDVPEPARRFAKWSAIIAMLLGCLGQVAYHLMVAAGLTHAPWQITTIVACLPVGVLGMGAALAHLLRTNE